LIDYVFLCVDFTYVDVDLLKLISIDSPSQITHHMTLFGL